MLGRFVLFVGIRVGIGILREVKGQHFADDTIPLLLVGENRSVHRMFLCTHRLEGTSGDTSSTKGKDALVRNLAAHWSGMIRGAGTAAYFICFEGPSSFYFNTARL